MVARPAVVSKAPAPPASDQSISKKLEPPRASVVREDTEWRRAWRRLLDEQCAMAREDPLRLRATVVVVEDCSISSSSSSSSETSEDSDDESTSSEEECSEKELVAAIVAHDGSRLRSLLARTTLCSALVIERAVIENDEAIVEAVVAKSSAGACGARSRESGATPLHHACALLNAHVAATLLARGASAEARDRNDEVPLVWLARPRVPRMNRLQYAARVDQLLHAFERHSPLRSLLNRRGRRSVLEAVLETDALAKGSRLELVSALVRRGANPLADGCLHRAARAGSRELVRALLASYVQDDARPRELTDVLAQAALGGCVEVILDARLSLDVDGLGSGRDTPLTAALRAGTLASVRSLLRRCSLHAEDASGASPLYVAIAESRTRTDAAVRMLLDEARHRDQPLIDRRCSATTMSSYAYALSVGALEAAAALVEHGARLDDEVLSRARGGGLALGAAPAKPPDQRDAFRAAMLRLLESQEHCDASIGPFDDDSTIGCHSFAVGDLVAPSMTRRCVGMGALRFVYGGAEPTPKDPLDYVMDLAVLAATWGLSELRDACVALASTKTRDFSLLDAKRFARAVGASETVVRRPLTPYTTRRIPPAAKAGVLDGRALARQLPTDLRVCHRPVHSAIVRARWPYLDALYRWTARREGTPPRDLWLSLPPVAIDGIVDHVYGLPQPQTRTSQDLLDLAALADQFLLLDLKAECDARLAALVDPRAVVALFDAAKTLGLAALLLAAARVVLDSLDVVVQTPAFSSLRTTKAAFVATVLRAARAVSRDVRFRQ